MPGTSINLERDHIGGAIQSMDQEQYAEYPVFLKPIGPSFAFNKIPGDSFVS
jgi:hypothetical protein